MNEKIVSIRSWCLKRLSSTPWNHPPPTPDRCDRLFAHKPGPPAFKPKRTERAKSPHRWQQTDETFLLYITEPLLFLPTSTSGSMRWCWRTQTLLRRRLPWPGTFFRFRGDQTRGGPWQGTGDLHNNSYSIKSCPLQSLSARFDNGTRLRHTGQQKTFIQRKATNWTKDPLPDWGGISHPHCRLHTLTGCPVWLKISIWFVACAFSGAAVPDQRWPGTNDGRSVFYFAKHWRSFDRRHNAQVSTRFSKCIVHVENLFGFQ